MCDEYSHNICGIFYIKENIPGPAQPSESYNYLIQNYNSQLTHSCKCIECNEDICPCLQISGGANYTACSKEVPSVKFRLSKSKDTSKCLIIECNDLCQCSINCGNRLVQKGPMEGLTVQMCNSIKGLGLFTDNFINQGSFICEYAGELLTKSQAISRQISNKIAGLMNYVFCLNEYCNNTTTQTFVDPSNFGNIGRYINHSCEPNCEIIPVRVNSPIPKLAIFSVGDISPGSEITFDYGSKNLSNSTVDIDKKKCLCNSSNCKGFMPFSDLS